MDKHAHFEVHRTCACTTPTRNIIHVTCLLHELFRTLHALFNMHVTMSLYMHVSCNMQGFGTFLQHVTCMSCCMHVKVCMLLCWKHACNRHVACMLHAICMHPTCIVHAPYMHVVHALCMHPTCILHACYLHIASTTHARCMNSTCIVHAPYMHFGL